MSTKAITAAEAREITETSDGMLTAIRAQIKIEAELWNRSVCNWGFDGVDDDVKNNIIGQLEKDGFTVEEFKDEEGNTITNQYKIKW